MNVLKLEPAVITGAVAAVITLLVAFGIPLTEDQKVAVLGVIAPLLALAQGLIVRAAVVPVAKLDAAATADYTGEHRAE